MTDQVSTRTGNGGGGSPAGAVKGVAGRTAERAGDVVDEAKSQVRAVAADAKSQARDLFDRGRQDLDREASARSQQVAGSARTLADRLGALADGDVERAGPLADLLREGQDRLHTLAGRLDEGPSAVLDDVRSFARRQPVLFLAAAGGLGFLAGRLVRAGRDADGSSPMTATASLPAADAAALQPPAPLPPPIEVGDIPTATGTGVGTASPGVLP